jgi:predicted nucleic acid-binding protein
MGQIKTLLAQMAGKKVYFDTNPILYFMNQTHGFYEACLPIFQALDRQEFTGFSSEIALSELLIKPLRDGDSLQARHVRTLFGDDGFFTLLPHDRETFELTADVRASKHLKMIDAIHVATAMQHGCEYFITGDNKIAKRITGIEIINVNDFLV